MSTILFEKKCICDRIHKKEDYWMEAVLYFRKHNTKQRLLI